MAPSAQSDSPFWGLFCRNWVACLICKRLFAGSWGPISHVFPVDAGEKNHRGPRKSLSYQRCYPISTGQSADSVQRGSSRPFISRTPPNLGRSLGGSHATGTEEAPYIKGATQSCPKRAAARGAPHPLETRRSSGRVAPARNAPAARNAPPARNAPAARTAPARYARPSASPTSRTASATTQATPHCIAITAHIMRVPSSPRTAETAATQGV